MEQFYQALITGLLMGGIYALIASGLNLVFGVMDIVNFAHGEFVMLGMYAVYTLTLWWGIDPYLTLPLVALFLIVVSAAIYWFLIAKVETRAHTQQILLTIGLSIVLINGAMMVWGPNYKTIDSPVASENIRLLGVAMSKGWVIAFVCAVVISLLLYMLLQRTYLGKKIRAVSQNRDAALLMGINTRSIYLVAFCISALVAGLGGALLANIYYISPASGSQFILKAFVIVVLGGMGSFWGTFIGGLIIGVTESLASVVMSPSLAPIVSYALFVLVLWLRPQGLFGRKGRV